MDSFGIIIIAEAERMPAVEPSVIGIPTGFSFVKNSVSHNIIRELVNEMNKKLE
jgi:hypothetical protein